MEGAQATEPPSPLNSESQASVAGPFGGIPLGSGVCVGGASGKRLKSDASCKRPMTKES